MTDSRNSVGWFEIPAADIERAKVFYEQIFGFEMQRHEMNGLQMAWFPFSHEGPGATGTLIQAEPYIPSHEGTMVYFSVEDIEAVLKKVEENGGQVLNPKMSIGEYGFVAHFEDSEGNRVALHSRN
jgi:predicted enzyme related to lactoylglutathione lyase